MSTFNHLQPNAPPAQLGPGELMGDPVAAALWAAVMQLDPTWQHEFLERLRTYLAVPELAGGSKKVRAVRLVSSVREAHALRREELAGRPGYDPAAPVLLDEDNYERLRKLNPECGWSPAGTMRRWVQGGWNDVLRRARLQAVPGGDVLVDSRRREMSWEEVAMAVRLFRDWRAERGHPKPDEFSMHDYIQWGALPDIKALPGRRPASQGPFDRFGGFPLVRLAALAGSPTPPNPKHMQPTVRSGSIRPRSGYALPPEVLHASIHTVKKSLRRVPHAGEYQTERRRLLAAAEAAGRPEPLLASYNVINSRYGDWNAALVAAGLPPFRPVDIDSLTQRARTQGPRNHIPEPDLLAGICEAYAELGEPFNSAAYRKWVARHDGISRATGRRLATYPCVYQRYRGQEPSPWKAACAAAGIPR